MEFSRLLCRIKVLRARHTRGARVIGVVVLALVASADLVLAGINGCNPWLSLPVLAVGMAAVLWPAERLPGWVTPALRTGVPAFTSGVLTLAVVLGASRQIGCAPGETTVLLSLLVTAVRTGPPKRAMVCACLDGAATLSLPLRYLAGEPGSGSVVAGTAGMLLLAAGTAAGLGGYLRVLDDRRRRVVNETRRAERLAMAADLHDFVAHHVTGVLIQTQMARMLAPTHCPPVDGILADIERSAAETLMSMRRMVEVLRGYDRDGYESRFGKRQPVSDLSALVGLVDRFTGPRGQKAVLDRSREVPDDLPPEVQAAAFRVVQEALTNVLRHAPDAKEIVVEVCFDGLELRVAVRDDGRGGPGMPIAALGCGFGLVGLSERVTALGGRLEAGPRPGRGWQVTASLPVADPDVPAVADAHDDRAAARN